MIGGGHCGAVYINGRKVRYRGLLKGSWRKLKVSFVVAGLVCTVVVWVKVQDRVDAIRLEDEKTDEKAIQPKKRSK